MRLVRPLFLVWSSPKGVTEWSFLPVMTCKGTCCLNEHETYWQQRLGECIKLNKRCFQGIAGCEKLIRWCYGEKSKLGNGRNQGRSGRASVREKVKTWAGQVQQEWEMTSWRVLSTQVLATQGSCGLGACYKVDRACKASYTRDLCIACLCVYSTNGLRSW